jgi:NAD(P)-dependent dehydrogenase (short-subunit alcohol dehydrogenase family)
MKTLDLEGKTYLLTGADGFLGKHLYRALSEEGAHIISVDIKTTDTAVELDISNETDVTAFINELSSKGITLDGIINNAAVSFKGANITSDQFLKTMQVNIQGTYNCITQGKKILKDSASIVNVSSIYGMLSPDFRIYDGNEELYSSSIYGASKSAIIQLTKYYAVQFAPIKINTISAGGIFQGHKDSFSEKYSERVPMKRMADPEEIVNAILFLLSDMSSYITGQNIIVDGGLSAW